MHKETGDVEKLSNFAGIILLKELRKPVPLRPTFLMTRLHTLINFLKTKLWHTRNNEINWADKQIKYAQSHKWAFLCVFSWFTPPPPTHTLFILWGVCLQWLSWQMKFWLLIKLKIADILWQGSLSRSYITSNSDWVLLSLLSHLRARWHRAQQLTYPRWEGGSPWVSPLAYQE